MTLLEAAVGARENAYAPYSGYRVGAAVETEDGQIFAGCNDENISYGLTICAERAAITAMVHGGGKKLVAVTVVTQDGGTPCGMCRQTLAEFASDRGVTITLATLAETKMSTTLAQLFPNSFVSAEVLRTASDPSGVESE
jgi:cytidine deaminase